MNLLLVDDDADTLELVSMFLRRHAITVKGVGTLREAEEALASTPFDGLLTDLSLPDGQGRTLLADGRPPQLRFAVVFSGHGSERERALTLASGFDAHWVKPLDEQTLKQLVAGLVPL